MESEMPDALKEAEELLVGDDLLKELHSANARLHQARQEMEKTMDDADFDHQHRVDLNSSELKAAERQVEEISEKIHKSLKPAPPDVSNG